MPAIHPALRRFIPSARALRFATIAIALLLAIYGAVGFWLLPAWAQPRLEQALAQAFDRPVTLGRLKMNPFTLASDIEGFTLYERDGKTSAVTAAHIQANMAFSSLWRRAPVLDALRIRQPVVRVIREPDGRYNYADIVARLFPPDSPPARYSLHNIEVLGGQINVDDRLEKVKHEIADIRLGIPFLSTLAYETAVYVHPTLQARINGAPLNVTGEMRETGGRRETTLKVHFADLDLRTYFGYLPLNLRFQLQSGRLNAALAVHATTVDNRLKKLIVDGSASVTKLHLRQHDGEELLSADQLQLQFAALELLAKHYQIADLSLIRPTLHLNRFRGGNLNLALLLPLRSAARPRSAEGTTFTIERLHVSGGDAHYRDYTVEPAVRMHFAELRAEGRDLGNHEDATGDLELSFKSDAGERLMHVGRVRGSPLRASGHLEMEGVQLPRWMAAYGAGGSLRKGRLDASGEYAWQRDEQGVPHFQLDKVEARLSNAETVAERGPRAWRAALVKASGGSLDGTARRWGIGKLEIDNATARVFRGRSGRWAWESDAPPASGEPPPWQYDVQAVQLKRVTLEYRDRSAATPVRATIPGIAGEIRALSNRPQTQASVDLRSRGAASAVSAAGTVSLNPVQAQLKLDAAGVDLSPFTPYLAKRLDVQVRRALLRLKGEFVVGGAVGDGSASRLPAWRFGGALGLSDVEIREPGDAPLLRWKQLSLEGVNLQQDRFAVQRVGLSDFHLRATVHADGRMNLQKLAKTSDTDEEEDDDYRIDIGQITLQRGRIDFSDHFVKPGYNAEIRHVSGEISALVPERSGRLDLRGALDGYAPVQVSGRINPFVPSFDLRASAQNIDLPQLSPYSVKYVGYRIERGKLSFRAHYRLNDGELSADNRLTLDQVVFGEQVDSPEAVDVPVRFAAALLQDSNGVIEMEVPISGSLDDPQFEIGGVMGRAVANLFWKAVSSPFTALASIFNSTQTLGFVEFDPGRAELDPTDIARLEALAQALRERPALRLDIGGRADTKLDSTVLKPRLLERRLGAAPGTPQRVQAVKKLYDAADFSKPRTILGLPRELNAAEMEKLLLENTAVGEEALLRLANDRSQEVRSWLIGHGGVSVERLYLMAPQLDTTPGEGSPARVDFVLR